MRYMTIVSVALLLDVSGSMMFPVTKLQAAQTDASTFVNIMHTGDNVGVVQFSDNATVIYSNGANPPKLQNITGLPIQNAAVTAIMATTSHDMTNIKDAINKGFELFPASPTHSAMVLLSDGIWNMGGNPVPPPHTSIPIYTIGFEITAGSPAAKSLQAIATQTSGKYHASADAWDLAEIYNEIAATTTRTHAMINSKEPLRTAGFKILPVTVSPGNTFAKFAVNWDNQGISYTGGTPGLNQINISLKNPSGGTVTPSTIAFDKGFVVLTVNTPVSGAWKVGVWTGNTGALKSTVAALEPSGPSLNLSIDSSDYKVGDTIPFVAKLSQDGNAVKDVKIDATIEAPQFAIKNLDESDEEMKFVPTLPYMTYPVETTEKETGEHHGEISTGIEGSYTVRINAEGKINGEPFTRVSRLSVVASS